MKRRWQLGTLFWVILSTCFAQAATTEKLKNEHVVVTETTLGAGQEQALADHRPSVLVFLDEGSIAIAYDHSPAKKSDIHRGETRNVPSDAEAIDDTGSTNVRLVRIAFLGSGSDEIWGKTGLAPNYELLSEDRYARIYDIKIPAHGREPQHTHHARVVVCLSGARLEHILPDGQIQPSTLQTGEIAWRAGGTHIGHNLGDTDLWVIAVEPK